MADEYICDTAEGGGIGLIAGLNIFLGMYVTRYFNQIGIGVAYINRHDWAPRPCPLNWSIDDLDTVIAKMGHDVGHRNGSNKA